MATLNFWFEFGSPYSMVAALRLLRALDGKPASSTDAVNTLPSCQVPDLSGVRVVYRPMFLGAVFKAAGQQMLPNVQVPVKARYLFHDVERSLNLLECPGFPSSRPAHWPPNTLLAGHMAWMLTQGVDYVCALDRNESPSGAAELEPDQLKLVAGFVWSVYEAEFISQMDIGNSNVMARLWDRHVVGAGAAAPSGERAVALAGQDAAKAGFKASTQAAIENSVFGAPTFTTEDGDLYWGNDRLIEAVHHHKLRHVQHQASGFCKAPSTAAL
ncbi:hypothetical protein GGF46_004657 [Coemansia sp. RSA 552]|nr:hypothetical protein GGF46_004657 [Coemansia sp. RSA 552]